MPKLPPLSFIYTFHGAFKNALIVILIRTHKKSDIPEQDYIYHLLQDLQADLQRFKDSIQQRKLHSIFLLVAVHQVCSRQKALRIS